MSAAKRFGWWPRVYVEEFGWALLPVRPRAKAPFSEFLQEVYRDSRTEPLKRAPALWCEVAYWLELEPNLNLGVFPSASRGLVVADIDRGVNPGLATPTVRSGREGGGYHLYFQSSHTVATAKQPWGDLQPELAVLPGSVHDSGAMYQWLPGLSPLDVPFMSYADAVDVLADLVP